MTITDEARRLSDTDGRALTAWTVACWLAGTWNGLPWGSWFYIDPSDYEEIA